MKYPYIILFFGLLIGCSSSVSTLPKTLVVRASSSSSALGADYPAELRITAKRMWISKNADCSEEQLIRDYLPDGNLASAVQQTILSSSSPDEEDYNCLILEVSDQLTFLPDDTAVNSFTSCEDSSLYTYDFFRNDNIGSTWVDYQGETIIATGSTGSPNEDAVTFFLSTDPSAIQARITNVNSNQLSTLASSFGAEKEIIFFMDFSSSITEISGECTMTAGDHTGNMGFR